MIGVRDRRLVLSVGVISPQRSCDPRWTAARGLRGHFTSEVV